jgi:hypothetical protein
VTNKRISKDGDSIKRHFEGRKFKRALAKLQAAGNFVLIIHLKYLITSAGETTGDDGELPDWAMSEDGESSESESEQSSGTLKYFVTKSIEKHFHRRQLY